LLPMTALPFLRHVPRSAENITQAAPDSTDISMPMKSCALLCMFIYNLAQGVVWTYLFIVGVKGGLTEQAVANGLTISQFGGIAGAFVATLVAQRVNPALGFIVGITASAISLYPLTGSFEAVTYAILVLVYNFAWNYTQPTLLSAMARFDRRGRVVV